MRVWMGMVLVLLVFSGCAYKNAPLTFSPYVPGPSAMVTGKSVQKVYLKAVIDARQQRSIIASALNSAGQSTGYATSGTALDLWVYEGLKRGLEARGYEVVNAPVKEAKTLTVNIDEFFAQYNGALLSGENLTGTMQLTLHVKVGETTHTKRVAQSQSRWHKPITASEDFKPFLQKLMNDVLARAIYEVHSL